MPQRARDLMLVVLFAALTFGGSFTCNDSDDDDEPDVDTQRQVTDDSGGEVTLPRD